MSDKLKKQQLKALLEQIEGLTKEQEISKIVGEATEKVRKETEKVVKEEDIETAIKMLKSGKFSIEEIKEYVPRLSIDEIRSLEKE